MTDDPRGMVMTDDPPGKIMTKSLMCSNLSST